jgi:hypothetical protein
MHFTVVMIVITPMTILETGRIQETMITQIDYMNLRDTKLLLNRMITIRRSVTILIKKEEILNKETCD